jgi:hypothetical protein
MNINNKVFALNINIINFIIIITRENPFASGSAKYNRILSEVH